MTNNTTKPDSLQPLADKAVDLFDHWFEPIETEVPARSRQFIEELSRRARCGGTRVTNEARWSAEPKLGATATGAARDR
jgi:hypothetical protein